MRPPSTALRSPSPREAGSRRGGQTLTPVGVSRFSAPVSWGPLRRFGTGEVQDAFKDGGGLAFGRGDAGGAVEQEADLRVVGAHPIQAGVERIVLGLEDAERAAHLRQYRREVLGRGLRRRLDRTPEESPGRPGPPCGPAPGRNREITPSPPARPRADGRRPARPPAPSRSPGGSRRARRRRRRALRLASGSPPAQAPPWPSPRRSESRCGGRTGGMCGHPGRPTPRGTSVHNPQPRAILAAGRTGRSRGCPGRWRSAGPAAAS